MPALKPISNAILASMANRLRLTLIRDELPEMLDLATNQKFTPRETLEFFFSREIGRREENRVRHAVMGAHFPFNRTFDDFDFNAQPSIDEARVRELAQLEWVAQAKNLLLLGQPGVGKTHLAIAFGRLAIQKGLSVAFYTAEDLCSLLDKAITDGTIKQKLLQLSKPKLLIIDEFGYTAFTATAAPQLFRLINSRYEKRSTIITSNKQVGEWASVLGDASLTSAILDRLLHHSEIMMIKGDSYRMIEKRKEGLLLPARDATVALLE